MNIIEVNVVILDVCVVIIIVCFNNFINDSLLEGVIDVLKCIGQVKDENIIVVWVFGVYELLLVVGVLVKIGKYDVVIVLGMVICGGIVYFEYVVGGVSNGLVYVVQDSEISVVFGVLIIESIE